jgi:hypothetical protein
VADWTPLGPRGPFSWTPAGRLRQKDPEISGRGEAICDLSAIIKVEVKPKKTGT